MGTPGVGTTMAWQRGSPLQAASHPASEIFVEKGSGPSALGPTQFTPACRIHGPPVCAGSVYTVHHGCFDGGLHPWVRLTQPRR